MTSELLKTVHARAVSHCPTPKGVVGQVGGQGRQCPGTPLGTLWDSEVKRAKMPLRITRDALLRHYASDRRRELKALKENSL